MSTQKLRSVAIIQARMGSTRLPGKVLRDLAGEPMLARVVERTRRARSLDSIVVATSDLQTDDRIESLCDERRWALYRGSEKDVLSRYYEAAREFAADIVVRVTSDCPLIDPGLIDEHVERLKERWSEVDFVSNMMQQTYPLGLAVEAMPMDVLVRMHRMSRTEALREHVTTLAYAAPERFQIEHVRHTSDLSRMRCTVDTAEDLEFVRKIFEHFGHDKFSWQEVLPVLEEHPEWEEIHREMAAGAAG